MRNIFKNIFIGIGFLVLVSVIVFGINKFSTPNQVDASVSRFAEYQSTTTRQAQSGTPIISSTGGTALLASGPATLGSVIITGPASGIINIYDATNTINGGIPAYATTTLASFPAGTATSTYTFDTLARFGILIELQGGSMPTSTITFRNN